MFQFKEVVLEHTCCVMLFMGVLQQPWIRSTIFTYPFKLEIGIWMGPQDSHANIMCPTQSINRMHLCHNMFVNHCPLFLFLSLSSCFVFL